jgi:hypothetical protein
MVTLYSPATSLVPATFASFEILTLPEIAASADAATITTSTTVNRFITDFMNASSSVTRFELGPCMNFEVRTRKNAAADTRAIRTQTPVQSTLVGAGILRQRGKASRTE